MNKLRTWIWIAALGLALAGCEDSGGSATRLVSDESACAGAACSPDPDRPAPPEFCGGIAGIACAAGHACVDIPSDDCDPAVGADCPSRCEPIPDAECRSDAQCLGDLRCVVCPDGQEACPLAECAEGRCFIAMPDCAPLPPEGCGGLLGIPCAEGFTCVDAPTEECPNGMAADCPGQCVPDVEPKCNEDADCPQLRAPCTLCADGSYTCPTSSCVEGLCRIEIDTCADSRPCSADGDECPSGFVCDLNVGDGCFPDPSGTECGGICVPEQRSPECGGFAGFECPDDHVCFDDPNDDCDPATGGADCGGYCRPVWERECTADADCPQLRMACSVCPDGSNACPSSTCDGGHCTVNFPACPFPGECSGDDECKPGYRCGFDPLADCFPRPDGSCPKVCLPTEQPRGCGGFIGATCPDGFSCSDDPGDDCDPNNGGADCPGVCEPKDVPGCESEADCPRILAPCTMCADGSYACPTAYCVDGQCGASIERCPQPASCGGIAGLECSAGYTCIEDQSDACDPARGGADCGGICVIEEKPPQCKEDGDCLQIMAACRPCADGTDACPRSYCEAGECRLDVHTCADPAE